MRTVLASSAGFEVAGETDSGLEAVELAASRQASLLLLDYRLPDIDGLEVARRVLAARPTTLIVLFAAHIDDATRAEATAIGIRGVVAKEKILDLPALLTAAIC